jgi:hypothetical protein
MRAAARSCFSLLHVRQEIIYSRLSIKERVENCPSVVNFNAAIFNRHQAQLCFCTDTAVENVFDVELFNPLHIMLLYFPEKV